MNAYEKQTVTDTRETIEDEFSSLVLEDCLARVDAGEISREAAHQYWLENTNPVPSVNSVTQAAIHNSIQ